MTTDTEQFLEGRIFELIREISKLKQRVRVLEIYANLPDSIRRKYDSVEPEVEEE